MEQIKTIFELIKLFAADQDVAPNSCKLYITNIKLFIRWCQRQNKDPESIRKPDIIGYKNDLFANKYSSLTIDSRITSLRKFYKWCDTNEYYNDITIGIKNPKKYQGYKKDPLTIDQVNTLLNSIDRTTITGKRDFAIINLMLRTGLRTIEITRMDIGDVELKEGTYYLNILRKGSQGNKTKISISDKTYDPINDYLVERLNVDDSKPLFVVTSYNCKGSRINTAGLSQLIKKRLLKANINSKKITAHSLRHTAALNALKIGASLYDVQMFLGHTSSNTTQLYIKAINEEKILINTPNRMLDGVF